MISPTNCPFCNKPLLNEFIKEYKRYLKKPELTSLIRKSCIDKLNHYFFFDAPELNPNQPIAIDISYNNQFIFIDYINNIIKFQKKISTKEINIPLFEPNMLNIHHFIKKVKILSLFI